MSRWRTALGNPWCFAWGIVWIATSALVAFRSTELDKCYLKAAHRFVEGADIYRPTTDGVGLWPYPPAMVLTVAPLAWVPEWMARVVWSGVVAASLVVAAWAITRAALAGVSNSHQRLQRVTALVTTGLLSHQLVLSPLTYQSHDPLIAAGMGLALVAAMARREVLAGIFLGAIGALKVTPLLFAPALALARRWRAVIAMVAAAAALSFLPDALRLDGEGALSRSFSSIVQSASNPAKAGGGYWHDWNPLAQNLSATITRLTVPTPPGDREINARDWSVVHLSEKARGVAIISGQCVVLTAVLVVVGFVHHRRPRPPSPLQLLTESGAIACGMLLLSPHSSNYHFAIEAFAVAPCIVLAIERRDRCLIALVCVLGLLGLPSGRDLIGNYAVDALLICGKLTLGACVALAGCVRAAWLLRSDAA